MRKFYRNIFSRMKKYRHIFFTSITWFLLSPLCYAEDLKVWTIERPPFAYQEDGEWKGFSIDLWNELASTNNISYSFHEFEAFSDMIQTTTDWEVDLSVANISITAKREAGMDFSQPIFDSGLNILAREQQTELKTFLSFFTNDLLQILLYIAVWIITLAHIFWVYNVAKRNIPVYTYIPEIFLVFFEVLRQIKEAYGLRILFTSILGISIFFVSYYSQQVAVVFASQNETIWKQYISEYINIEIPELSELRVWVTKGSTSEKYMARKSIATLWYDDMQHMIDDLWDEKLDVIIHDDPLLRYFATNDGKGEYTVVRKTFQPEKFGIAFAEWSQLREQVDRSILELHESGRYQEIYEKYFGN